MTGAGKRRHVSVLIAGPTGGGKSKLALELAYAHGGEVINADAMQVYRELRILTARPGSEEEALAPHRLYGTVSARDAYSAGRWLGEAAAAIGEAHAAGRAAIVVGGTGLYFESLLKGLAQIPPVPADIRAKWRNLMGRQGLVALRSELESRDPEMAARIGPGDRQRLVRALEVLDATGRSLGWWQAQTEAAASPVGDACRLVVAPPRETLHERIDARARAMVADGALDEVRALIGLGLNADLPAMKAIGVRELAQVDAGAADLETALAAMSTASRRYAKRQLTWARGRMADWSRVGSLQEGAEMAAGFLRRAR